MRAYTPEEKITLLTTMYGAVTPALSNSLRGLIVASEGKDLCALDFASVESRVLAWLAGEQWKLDAYAEGAKIYEMNAALIYGIPVEEVTKDQRQIGKVAELACGYQGGEGAFQKMAKTYGVKVPNSVAAKAKNGWRTGHPNVKKYWYALEEAAVAATRSNQICSAGPKGREVKFRVKGSFLWCQLPSGRVLCYPYPRLCSGMYDKDALQYMSVNGLTRKWELTNTYGGKLAENITQAVSRDLLAYAMKRFEKLRPYGWRTVMHVHDEIVGEINMGCGKKELHELEKEMCVTPPWAAGLPIAAEGWIGRRYRK